MDLWCYCCSELCPEWENLNEILGYMDFVYLSILYFLQEHERGTIVIKNQKSPPRIICTNVLKAMSFYIQKQEGSSLFWKKRNEHNAGWNKSIFTVVST